MDGQAKVRIVQASIKAPLLDVSVDGGKAIADQVPFATTTAYHLVEPGVLTIRVQSERRWCVRAAARDAQRQRVYSVLVLDGKTTLTAQLRVDAASVGAVPIGGVETGAGGTATHRTADAVGTHDHRQVRHRHARGVLADGGRRGPVRHGVPRRPRRPRVAVWGPSRTVP